MSVPEESELSLLQPIEALKYRQQFGTTRAHPICLVSGNPVLDISDCTAQHIYASGDFRLALPAFLVPDRHNFHFAKHVATLPVPVECVIDSM